MSDSKSFEIKSDTNNATMTGFYTISNRIAIWVREKDDEGNVEAAEFILTKNQAEYVGKLFIEWASKLKLDNMED